MLKAVLFDMDGVLVDTEPEYIVNEIKIARGAGIHFTEEEQSRYAGIRPVEMWTALKEKYGFEADPQDMADAEAQIMDAHYATGDLHPFDESVKLLKACADSGLKVAVATSTSTENAQRVIWRLGLETYVGALSTSCMTGKSKPEPDIYLLAARLLGVDTSECAAIDDAASGVQSARAAGVKAVIGVQLPGRGQDLSCADVVVGSLKEIDICKLKELVG